MTKSLSLINKIESGELVDLFRRVEMMGDIFMSPTRLFFGRAYLAYTEKGSLLLKSSEDLSWNKRVGRLTAIVLLPLSLLSTIVGAAFKKIAHIFSSKLAEKYTLPFLINARAENNFAGHLPLSPLTPNCVNSQEKSFWGKLYNVEPIKVPEGIVDSEALNVMDQVISGFSKDLPSKLIEKRDTYRHYEFTVEIPKLGTFIDDLDLWYDSKRRVIDIRSASRRGFRDALNLNFSIPGANKKRVELLREGFKSIL